jgi:hypothetical protein
MVGGGTGEWLEGNGWRRDWGMVGGEWLEEGQGKGWRSDWGVVGGGTGEWLEAGNSGWLLWLMIRLLYNTLIPHLILYIPVCDMYRTYYG